MGGMRITVIIIGAIMWAVANAPTLRGPKDFKVYPDQETVRLREANYD
jgi:hypothetical protein